MAEGWDELVAGEAGQSRDEGRVVSMAGWLIGRQGDEQANRHAVILWQRESGITSVIKTAGKSKLERDLWHWLKQQSGHEWMNNRVWYTAESMTIWPGLIYVCVCRSVGFYPFVKLCVSVFLPVLYWYLPICVYNVCFPLSILVFMCAGECEWMCVSEFQLGCHSGWYRIVGPVQNFQQK